MVAGGHLRNATSLECLRQAIEHGVRFRAVTADTTLTNVRFVLAAPQRACPAFRRGAPTPTFVVAAEKHLEDANRTQVRSLSQPHEGGRPSTS